MCLYIVYICVRIYLYMRLYICIQICTNTRTSAKGGVTYMPYMYALYVHMHSLYVHMYALYVYMYALYVLTHARAQRAV